MAILVVEDDAGVRDSFVALLREEGYEVHAVQDPIEAAKWLESQTPSLILLDLALPWMDGAELAMQVRKNRRLSEVPIIIVSARPDIEKRARVAGATRWLRKPMSFEELLHAIQNLAVTRGRGIPALSNDR